MFKKFLCGVVAAALVFTAAPVLPANITVADAAMIEATEGAIIGKEDRTTGFWKDVTKGLKLGDGETLNAEFENHGSADQNYFNFTYAFMTHEDMSENIPQRDDKTYMEYAIVRADNYAVGGDWNNKINMSFDEKEIKFESDVNWDTWKSIVQDSNVVITMNRVKNLVSITQVITNIADPTKKITTKTVVSVGKAKGDESYNDNVYVAFTIDHAYLKFKKFEVVKTTGDVTIAPPANTEADNKKPTTPGPSQKATQKAKFTVKKGKKKVSKVTVKKGKKVTLKVTVIPTKAKLSLVKLTKKQKKIANVTFKKGKLTIKGKKKGSLTVKITSSRQGVYKKTTKSIKVTVKK